MTVNPNWSTFQRQPGAAFYLILLNSFIKIAKGFWPFLLVMLFSKKQGDGFLIYLVLLLPIAILFFSVLDFLFFRFSVSENQLLVNAGVFKKKNLVFPLNKIQAVHLEQNWLHQILNLSQVSFDSPGADEAEVKIILGKDDAGLLKEYVLGISAIAETEKDHPSKQNIANLSLADLIKLGLSANHLETLAIMAGVGFSFFNNIRDIVEDQLDNLFRQSTSDLLNSSVTVIIYLALIILFISVIVSFLRIVVQYANFSIFQSESGFSVSSGLINTTEKAIPFKRVQFISWKTNWIRKKIPLYLFEYHSVGSATSAQKLKIKIPVTSPKLLQTLAAVYHPIPENELPYLKISTSYIYRTTLIRGVLPFLVLGTTAFFYLDIRAIAVISILPFYVLISSYFFCKKFKLHYDANMLHFYKGVLGENNIILDWTKIQAMGLEQSLYQRKKELADLIFFTAGGKLTIPFIRLEQARVLQNYALYKIESTIRPWM